MIPPVRKPLFSLSERRTTLRTELLGGVTILMMVITYNIANGLTAGLTIYPLVKSAAGRGREVKPGAWTLAALCASYYLFGLPH
jgi:xanthine/uracil/vitamin C permease (AzgA family)